jgi:hypothetical protein
METAQEVLAVFDVMASLHLQRWVGPARLRTPHSGPSTRT